MTLVLTRIRVEDYDAWKSMFDAGRNTVRQAARGHRIVRSLDDPNEIFIQVAFDDVSDAEAAREQLRASGALDRVGLENGPTIAEVSEAVDY